MGSLIEARFNMKATVWPGAQAKAPGSTPGRMVTVQDPDTGAITQRWESSPDTNPTDNIIDGSFDIVCEFRGIIAAGTRGAAATETFGKDYLNMNIVKMRFPLKYRLTNADRVTNVRTFDGVQPWLEQNGDSMVWDIRGVTPVIDPLGRRTDSYALLERVQNR